MREGKLSEPVMKRSVLRQLTSKYGENIKTGVKTGGDAAVVCAEGTDFAVAVSSYVLESEKAAYYAVNAAVNKLAVAGVTDAATISLSILLPEDYEETNLKKIMCTVDETCTQLHIQVADADVAVSRAVNAPIFQVTAYGAPTGGYVFDKAKVKAGQDIVVTKYIGLEGTAVLSIENEELLLKRYTETFIHQAQAFVLYASVLGEAAVAFRHGATAMHAVGQGGILGALRELAENCDIGLEADMKKIPIKQETVEICEFFGYNPYQLISGGSLIVIVEDGYGLVRELEKAGISAAVIGKVTDSNDRVILRDDERRFIDLPQMDEIWKRRD
ncbi:MAG: hydrogenase maturation factor [Lachnospiraceae bacterium]|nr:hydrogenase maturation factor [Lachnospiraceae bacterium]